MSTAPTFEQYFDPTLPNIFGPPITLAPDEEADLPALLRNPLLHKLVLLHCRAEYVRLLERNPLKLSPDELRIHHAFVAGCYSLARNLSTCQDTPEHSI